MFDLLLKNGKNESSCASRAGIATRLHILPVASLHICLSKGARVGKREEGERESNSFQMKSGS